MLKTKETWQVNITQDPLLHPGKEIVVNHGIWTVDNELLKLRGRVSLDKNIITMLKFPNLATVLWSGGLPRWLSSKEPTCDAGATGVMGANPGAGQSPGGGHGNPHQCSYSCLVNPMDRGAWQATVYRAAKGWTQLIDLAYLYTLWPSKRLSFFSSICTLFSDSCCNPLVVLWEYKLVQPFWRVICNIQQTFKQDTFYKNFLFSNNSNYPRKYHEQIPMWPDPEIPIFNVLPHLFFILSTHVF